MGSERQRTKEGRVGPGGLLEQAVVPGALCAEDARRRDLGSGRWAVCPSSPGCRPNFGGSPAQPYWGQELTGWGEPEDAGGSCWASQGGGQGLGAPGRAVGGGRRGGSCPALKTPAARGVCLLHATCVTCHPRGRCASAKCSRYASLARHGPA